MDVAGNFFQSISWSTSAPERESLKDPSIQVSLLSRWSSSTCELCIVTMHIATHPLLHHHIFNVLVSLGPQETNSNHQTPIFYKLLVECHLSQLLRDLKKNPNLRCWNLGVLLKLRPNNLIQVDGVVKDVKPPTSHHPVLQFWYWIDMYILYIMCILCVYIYILCISKYLIQSVLDFKDKIMFPWFSNE